MDVAKKVENSSIIFVYEKVILNLGFSRVKLFCCSEVSVSDTGSDLFAIFTPGLF